MVIKPIRFLLLILTALFFIFITTSCGNKTFSGKVEGNVYGDGIPALATITEDGKKTEIYLNGSLVNFSYTFVEANSVSVTFCSENPPASISGISVGIYKGADLVTEDYFNTPAGWGTIITPSIICSEAGYTTK